MMEANTRSVTPQISLIPLRMGEILDQAIRLYQRNFLTFIGILAVVQVPITLISMASLIGLNVVQNGILQSESYNVDPTAGMFSALASTGGVFISIVLHFILVQGVAGVALARAITDSYTGRPTSVFNAYRLPGSLWRRLLGALLLSGLVSVGIWLWMLVPCAGWFTGIGALVFFAGAVTPLLASVVVLENQNASGSVRRAWDLARSRMWWMLGFGVLVYLFNLLIVTGPTLLLEWGMTLIPLINLTPALNGVLQTISTSLLGLVSNLIFLPLQSTAYILAYFDLRVRAEGLDLALAVAQAQGPLEDFRAVAASSAPAPQQELVTSRDWGRFALISVGGIVLYFVLVAVLVGVMAVFFQNPSF